jgi:S1-C subfamily serine protease
MIFLCSILFLGQASPSRTAFLEDQTRQIDLIARTRPAVISIFLPGTNAGGSGVLISADGQALTNYHVISQHPAVRCGAEDGKVYNAVLVGIDPIGDLALIRLLGRNDFPFLPIAPAHQARVGQRVYAMGNPLSAATNLVPSVSVGIISGIERYQAPTAGFLEYTAALQTDAPINPGNSGGPLIDEQGAILGINGRISLEKRGRVNVGVAYAIASHQIENFLPLLQAGRIAPHAHLGATVRTADDGRVLVDSIDTKLEPYHRGLRIGDEIILVQGTTIQSSNQLLNLLGTIPAGWDLSLTYRRDGQTQSFTTRTTPKLRPLPSPPTNMQPLAADLQAWHRPREGWANDYFQQVWKDQLWPRVIASLPIGAESTFRFQQADDSKADVIVDQESVTWKTADQSETWPRGQVEAITHQDDRILAVVCDTTLRCRATATPVNVDYLGTFPTPSLGTQHILAQTQGPLVIRWYLDPKTETLSAMEFSSLDSFERITVRWPTDSTHPQDHRHWIWESTNGKSGSWEILRTEDAP